MGFVLYHLIQFLWGLPQTLLGSLIWVATSSYPEARFRNARVRFWGLRSGLSLGSYMFLPRHCSRRLLVHEYGHTIQSLVLGPLYIPLMLIPSALWAGLPQLQRWRSVKSISYYSFYTERLADFLGVLVTGEDSMGMKSMKAARRS